MLLKSTADFRLHINPAIKAFLKTADLGASYTDYTDEVTDRDTATVATLDSLDTLANGDYVLFCTDRLIGGLNLDLGNMNTTPSVLSGQYWKSDGTWANLATFTDGTISPAGTCLGQDGNITWTVPTDALQVTINGVTGYWWRLKVSVALDASVTVREAAALNRDANRAYCYAGVVYPIALGSEAGAIEALVASGTGTLDVVWCYGDVLQALGSQLAAATIADGANVALGTTTDAAASATVDENATARTGVSLWKGIKNILIDLKDLLNGGLPTALAAGGGLKVEGVAGGVAQPVQPFAAILETALTEIIDKDDTEVSQNDYSKSVSVALGGTYSGEIIAVGVVATELGTGAVRANAGNLYVFTSDPSVAAGDTALLLADWQSKPRRVAITDWTSDANGGLCFVTTAIPFPAVDTLYVCFQNLGVAINDAAGDDEELHVWLVIRRDS